MLNEKRNYGVDLFRIAATFMICLIHSVGHGGILANAAFLSHQYKLAWLIASACACAVNCYGVISGYVGFRAKHRWSSYATLWLTVFLIMLLYTAGYAIFSPGSVTAADWVKVFFPASTRQYWYFSSYTVLFLLMPLLTPAIEKLTQKQFKVLLLTTLLFFSVFNTAFYNQAFFDPIWNAKNEPFGLLDGYSGLWLIELYLVGAYFGKYGFPEKLTAIKGLLVYIISVLIAWIVRLLIDRAVGSREANGYLYLASYVSPLMVTAAVGLLAFFSRLRISVGLQKVIAFAAPSMFSVYLIQNQPLLWQGFMNSLIVQYADVATVKLLGILLGTALCIFFACFLLDLPRRLLFSKLRLSKRLSALEDRIRSR